MSRRSIIAKQFSQAFTAGENRLYVECHVTRLLGVYGPG